MSSFEVHTHNTVFIDYLLIRLVQSIEFLCYEIDGMRHDQELTGQEYIVQIWSLELLFPLAAYQNKCVD